MNDQNNKLITEDRTRMMIFSGNAHLELARNIAANLKLPLGKANVSRFSDGEIMVEIGENVRGKDVFVVQPTCRPTNCNLMELIIMTDALRRASAGRITAVMPYIGYSRQDRRVRSARVPITAKVVANMLTTAGVNRVLTVDLHAEQIQGFFDIPVDNVYASPLLIADIWRQKYPNLIVVSPDVGGADYGGYTLSGICTAGPARTFGQGADHRESRRQHADHRRREPRPHG